jgi:hypothetical protein
VTCLPLLLTVGFGNPPKKEASQVKKTARFVIWICSKFTRQEIEEIIQGLLDVLANRNPDAKPKDDFKESYLLTRKRKVILLSQLILKILPLKYLKVLSARFVVLPHNTFILMMVKNVLSLSVKYALLYHKYILIIGVRLNTFAIIVAIRFIFGKSEEMSSSINAIMTSVHIS